MILVTFALFVLLYQPVGVYTVVVGVRSCSHLKIQAVKKIRIKSWKRSILTS